jgi:hypothetical protein
MIKNILLLVFFFNTCSSQNSSNSKPRYIYIPTVGLCIVALMIGFLCWKRVFRSRRPVYPYNNPQVAIISQVQQWPPPTTEQPPPPYYTVVNTATVPPSVLYTKQ